MIVKRIGPLSCARIAGAIYAAIGLLIGAIFSLFAVFGMAFAATQGGFPGSAVSPLLGTMLGLGAIIVLPIFYGALGFVFALISAWLYNLVASKVGGIEIDVS